MLYSLEIDRSECALRVVDLVKLKMGEGPQLCLLLNAATQRDLDGEITGVIGIAHDITEQKKREGYF